MLVTIEAASTPGARFKGGNTMKNPLDSIWGTIITGLVLTVILVVAAKSLLT